MANDARQREFVMLWAQTDTTYPFKEKHLSANDCMTLPMLIAMGGASLEQELLANYWFNIVKHLIDVGLVEANVFKLEKRDEESEQDTLLIALARWSHQAFKHSSINVRNIAIVALLEISDYLDDDNLLIVLGEIITNQIDYQKDKCDYFCNPALISLVKLKYCNLLLNQPADTIINDLDLILHEMNSIEEILSLSTPSNFYWEQLRLLIQLYSTPFSDTKDNANVGAGEISSLKETLKDCLQALQIKVNQHVLSSSDKTTLAQYPTTLQTDEEILQKKSAIRKLQPVL